MSLLMVFSHASGLVWQCTGAAAGALAIAGWGYQRNSLSKSGARRAACLPRLLSPSAARLSPLPLAAGWAAIPAARASSRISPAAASAWPAAVCHSDAD
jgi:hypothetical protein